MKKKLLAILAAVSVMTVLAIPTFAADPVDVQSVMTTSFTSISDQMMGTISSVLPIALGIIGAILAVTFGIKLFKKLTGKA